jgi:hypothetical protein
MLFVRTVTLAGLALLAALPAPAQAGRGSWSIGFRFAAPVYPRPYCGCYVPYYYYRPYPVVLEPAPVYVQPAPVVVQPVYTTASPTVASAPQPAVSRASAAAQPPALDQRQLDAEHYLRQLAHPDERARSEAVLQLGRLKLRRAVDPLAATLAGDGSPAVREATARALGLIGSPKGLPALRRAVQVDADLQVRHSAQFAIDVIEVNGGR